MLHTYAETLDLLKEIVASKPADYKYTTDPRAVATAKEYGEEVDVNDAGEEVVTSCYYRHSDSTPACLVGQVLYKLHPDFVPMEEGFGSHLLIDTGIEFDDDAVELLRNVQMNQDMSVTWAESLADAEKSHG